jgi:hypothetical protein
MKKFQSIFLSAAAIVVLVVFQNCPGSSEETAQQKTERLLKSKSWSYSSVSTPDNTATIGSDWGSFSIQFNGTSMSASGHATGASAVWPNGSYTVSENGRTITRSDGVDMLITTLTETNLNVVFTITGGKEIDGRIAALDGEYGFNLN